MWAKWESSPNREPTPVALGLEQSCPSQSIDAGVGKKIDVNCWMPLSFEVVHYTALVWQQLIPCSTVGLKLREEVHVDEIPSPAIRGN